MSPRLLRWKQLLSYHKRGPLDDRQGPGCGDGGRGAGNRGQDRNLPAGPEAPASSQLLRDIMVLMGVGQAHLFLWIPGSSSRGEGSELIVSKHTALNGILLSSLLKETTLRIHSRDVKG